VRAGPDVKILGGCKLLNHPIEWCGIVSNCLIHLTARIGYGQVFDSVARLDRVDDESDVLSTDWISKFPFLKSIQLSGLSAGKGDAGEVGVSDVGAPGASGILP
jgi:hypothetical protein